MIIDKLENSSLYENNDLFRRAFSYLKSIKEFPNVGKVELCGDDLFVNIDKYSTKQERECKFEAHKRYIDIQLIHSGREKIKWHPVELLSESVAYSSDNDVAFLDLPEEVLGEGVLESGYFMILYPDDAHMPQISPDSNNNNVEKFVVKVAIDKI